MKRAMSSLRKIRTNTKITDNNISIPLKVVVSDDIEKDNDLGDEVEDDEGDEVEEENEVEEDN